MISPPSTAVVAKTPAALMQKQGGLCLHRPVRSDQLEQTGLFWEGDLKENEGLDGG